jgi:hypothetical protein
VGRFGSARSGEVPIVQVRLGNVRFRQVRSG